MNALQFRRLIEEKGNLAAAQAVQSGIKTAKQADAYIFTYVTKLLSIGEYRGAALILWGDRVFNPRPRAVKAIWDAIEGNVKTLIMGCGSVGKSYSGVIWHLLDWLRDPEYTSVKIISTTAGHAKSNTFSTIIKLHRTACIKLPGKPSSEYIGLDPKERKSGISVVAIPEGDDGRGRLQGFHPDPRPTVHPILGPSSRVRAFIDECEEVPLGLWEGIDNLLLSQEGKDTIKVTGAYNPKDQTSKTAQNAEPDGGWEAFDIESGVRGKNTWISRNKWFVLRIDGRRTENVEQRKSVYPGFLSYQAFRELELKDGGNSLSYYTFGRGAYPPEGSIGVIVSSGTWNGAKGEFVFINTPIRIGGVDTAVDGRDQCVLTAGRMGLASGFQKAGGKLVRFKESRMVIQIDQQFTLKKGKTKIVGDGIISMAKQLSIAPEYLCIDATGNGSAVYSYVKAIWSEDVQGIDFNANATNVKILEQDQFTPDELYEGIVTEVWFAVSRWLEFGFMAISPGIRRDPLESEVLGRRHILGGGKKQRVEKKDDYKKRLGHSPDFGDSITILLHGARFRGSVVGSMTEERKPERSRPRPRHGIVDVPEWLEENGV